MIDERQRNGRPAARRMVRLPLLGAALVAAAASGCGLVPGGGDDAGQGPISGLLTAIPDTPDNRVEVLITDRAGLAEALGTPWPLAAGADGLPSDEAVDAFLDAMLTSRDVMASAPLAEELSDQESWRTELGFTAIDIAAVAEAGVPPSNISVYRVTVKPSVIADAVAADPIWSSELHTDERDGATIYSWGDDPLAFNPQRVSSVRRLGRGGAMAVTDKGLVIRSADPAAAEAAADAVAGGGGGGDGDGDGSLADTADFAQLAEALDALGCHEALLSDRVADHTVAALAKPSASPADLARLEEQLAGQPALGPYRAIGLGTAVDDDGHGFAVFAFATASESEAKATVEAFAQVIAEGTSGATRRPWSELMTVRDTSTDGSLAVVTVDTDRLSIGFEAFRQRDTLLAARPAG